MRSSSTGPTPTSRRPRGVVSGFAATAVAFGCALATPGCSGARATASPPTAAPLAAFSHADFDAFLARHVDDRGRIDYARALEDRADLDRYLASLRSTSPDSAPQRFPTEHERLGYWINAYNASVIHAVLVHYPIASVRDVEPPALLFFLPRLSGFFLFQRTTLGGQRYDLYGLENRIIRRRFDEPRLHFALNCASQSCPVLPARAFDPARLESALEAETVRFIRDPANVDIDPEARQIRLSAIFDWYDEDFTDSGDLVEYIEPYLDTQQRAALAACGECEVSFNEYDWALNDRKESAGEQGTRRY